MSLNSTQLSNIDRIIGAKSLCSAVVRLYRTTGDDWEYTGIVGAAAISRKNGFATISFVDLESQSELFAEELYYNFNYQTPKPFFHYFEVQDCVAGFSFADDGEAGNFSMQVNNNKPSKSQGPPPINTPPPQNTMTTSQPIQQPPRQTPTTNQPAPSSQDKGKKKEKEKGGGGGFFSRLFGGAKKEEEVHEISGPTNFRHESHIGWDPVNGFDIRNIPPAWKELFKKAGVKKSDLQDKDTAKLVMETIVENIGGPPQNTPPPPSYPNQSTPPPPPPRGNNTGGDSFQTPPPPPTMEMGSNAPPPPTPPPPPTFDSNAPPPPMPPPSFSDDKPSAPRGGGGGGNAPLSFAEQLKNKQTSGLKTVDKPIENLPQLPEDTGGLANALASALKNRRGAIEEDRDSDDRDSGDEWSD